MLVLIVILLLLVYMHLKIRRKTQCSLPGPRPYPIIGNALEFITDDSLVVLSRMSAKYGKLYKMTLGPDLYILMSDPADVEVILSNYKYNTKALSYKYLSSWLKDGLITSDGEIWHRHRKLLTPTFHFKILENSIDIMHKHAKILNEQLQRQTGKADFNVQLFVEKCSLDVITEAAMNVEINSQTSDNATYLHAVKRVTEITVNRIFKLWLQPDFLYKLIGGAKEFETSLDIMENQSKNVIALKRKKIIEKRQSQMILWDPETIKKKTRVPFLDWMLTESDFSDDEIHAEVMSFMFAGHDTTTAGISFNLYQLSQYPEVQEKVYQEIMTVLPKEDRTPSLQDLSNLRYTENVIKETLRLFPPVPMIGRTTHSEITLPGGQKIPANSQVNVFIYQMHRDPELYSEPEQFKPERFNEERKHPFAYIPFSAGPRNCVGQKLAMLEMKIIIATLLRNYQLLPAANSGPLSVKEGLILRAENGIPVRLVERNQTCNQ